MSIWAFVMDGNTNIFDFTVARTAVGSLIHKDLKKGNWYRCHGGEMKTIKKVNRIEVSALTTWTDLPSKSFKLDLPKMLEQYQQLRFRDIRYFISDTMRNLTVNFL